MKTLLRLTLLLALVLVPVRAAVPTPLMAMSWKQDLDPKKWELKRLDGSARGLVAEFVPAGDDLNAWKEMVAQQVVFFRRPLAEYVARWKERMLKADPGMTLKEEDDPDGSITVSYTSFFAREQSIRRFVPGPDGVYMLAYHVRPGLAEVERLQLWREILRQAKLSPNPELATPGR
ncbi:MAG: hypothetical protein JSR48_14550 [Verrucomicrobia bacterium]|nr:hypothetical protein [Verrucomicrobiota bacterium]